jgi:aminoglycoside 3-N-acetyltransferase I
MRTSRLVPGDRALAKHVFTLMADVFDEPAVELSDAYVDRLLGRTDFWVIAAFSRDEGDGASDGDGDDIIGGLTAHTLPMTRAEYSEVFIYDLAVRPDHQRRGVGRRLVLHLRTAAAALGIDDVFVPADDEDIHALDFYRAIGGAPSAVTIFTFGRDD